MRTENKRSINERKGERGSVLAVSVLGMFAFLLAAGLAIDISHLYSAKTELQNAADAAALAAATQLNSTSGGIKQAVVEAKRVVNNYDFNRNVVVRDEDVTFAINLNGTYLTATSAQSNAAQIRFVRVKIQPSPVNMSFAALAIGDTQNIDASAVAGMSVGLTMNKFYTAFTFVENAASPLLRGQTYTLASKTWNTNTANSYRILAGPGGELITTGTVYGYGYANVDYTIAKLSEPDACRYARIGISTRFGDYSVHPNANAKDEPPDTIISEGITYKQYRDMQGAGTVERADGMKNRRIMVLPIATSANYNTTVPKVNADRLGAFFVKRKMSGCGLEVEYIGERFVVPLGGYTPGGIQSNELSIPLLYK